MGLIRCREGSPSPATDSKSGGRECSKAPGASSVTATQPLARVWLPSDGTALGVDWSGSEKAFKKIWCSKIEFGSGGACLREVQKPFSSQGPASISSHFAQWLEAQEFDVAGLDFCFGLN